MNSITSKLSNLLLIFHEKAKTSLNPHKLSIQYEAIIFHFIMYDYSKHNIVYHIILQNIQ